MKHSSYLLYDLVNSTIVGFLAPTMGYLGVCISELIIWITCAIFVLIVLYSNKNFRAQIKRNKKG